jgi:hypothetical protein
MPITISKAPVFAEVARKIMAAPNKTRSTDKIRRIVCLFNVGNFNGSNERVPDFHQTHDPLLTRPDKRGVPLLLCRGQDGYPS